MALTLPYLILSLVALGPGPDSLPRIHSRAEFDSISRIADYPYTLPHVLFVIDRLHQDRIYYVNSKRFESHRVFANATYLSLETGQKFFQDNYLRSDRRFYMGTVSYQTPIRKWTIEFWEGDLISKEGLKETARIVQRTFFAPVAFKPNSLHQEEIGTQLAGVPMVLSRDIVAPSDYMPVSLGAAVGRLRVLDKFDDKTVIQPDEIVVLPNAPVDLPPVAGTITSEPASPLSHISLRSKSLGIPDAYIKGAQVHLMAGRERSDSVRFVTKPDQHLIGKPTQAELTRFLAKATQRKVLLTPKADLSVTAIADLGDQRASMVTVYASKVGEPRRDDARPHSWYMDVPNGFSLPFSAYRDFVKANSLDKVIAGLLNDKVFRSDPVVRKNRLADLRKQFLSGKQDASVAKQILEKAHAGFPGQGLFVRSSTNSEDLPNFNGAGFAVVHDLGTPRCTGS